MQRLTLRLSVLVLALFASRAGAAEELPPDQVVTTAAKAFVDGKPELAWQLLPESYQKDVETLMQSAIAKVDPALYDQVVGSLKKMTAMMKAKKKLVLANPLIAQQDEALEGMLSKNYEAFVGMYETLFESDLGSHEKAKAIKIDAFLKGAGGKFMSQYMKMIETVLASEAGKPLGEANEMAAAIRKIHNVKASVVKQEGDTATVKIEVPDEEAEEIQFKRVEGKWVPADMADGWKDGVGEMKEMIASITPEDMQMAKVQVGVVLAMMDNVVTMLDRAQTQEEFDAAVNGMMQMFNPQIEPGIDPPVEPQFCE